MALSLLHRWNVAGLCLWLLALCTVGGAGAVDHFSLSSIATPQARDAAFPVTITAQDAGNATDTSFTGPVYLRAGVPSAPVTIGTITPNVNTWDIFDGSWQDSRTQVLYLPSELGAAKTLSGLALHATNLRPGTMLNFTIRLKHTTKANFSIATFENTGWTTVYQRNYAMPATGWVYFPFTTAFAYDGISNLMVDFSFNGTSYPSFDGRCSTTATPGVYRMMSGKSDSTNGNPLDWLSGTPAPTKSYFMPTIKFLSHTQNVPVTPTSTGAFTNGAWAGSVTLTQTASDIRLIAIDEAGHTGTSNLFSVQAPDLTPPDTIIYNPYIDGERVHYMPVMASWGGSDNISTELTYQSRLDGAAWPEVWSSDSYASFDNLADGEHTLEVRARDAAGNIDPTPASRSFFVDTTDPVISAVVATPTQTGCTITWTTDESATTNLEYGFTDLYGFWASTTYEHVLAHSVTLSELIPGTVYHYKISSSDDAYNTAYSADLTFTTLPDLTPPDTTITEGPVAGSTVKVSPIAFTWSGSDNIHTGNQLTYCWRLDGGAWSAWDAATTVSITPADGQHTFEVRARDANLPTANVDASPAARIFTLDRTPPIFSAINATPGMTTCTIVWTTNEPASTRVAYGLTDQYGTSTPLEPALGTGHEVELTGLTLNTSYHFQVLSTDAIGNVGASTDQTFTTLADTTPPNTTISGGPAAGSTVGSLPITVTWSGSDDHTPGIFLTYSWQLDGGGWSAWTSDISHDFAAMADGAHTFDVKARDAALNVDASPATRSFTLDTTPPAFSALGTVPGQTSCTITWTTNEAASTRVAYGLTDQYGTQSALAGQLVTSHSVQLTGLQPNTLYHFQALSADAFGHAGASTDQTFTTLPDTTAPETSITGGPSEGGVAPSLPVTLTWTGSDNATATPALEYSWRWTKQSGPSSGWSAFASATTTDLVGLTDGNYTFEVKARDAASNVDATSAVRHFTLDTLVPEVTVVTVDQITASAAVVNWTTNKPTTMQVFYRVVGAGAWASTTRNNALALTHTQGLIWLTPASQYEYYVESADFSSRVATSASATFTTVADLQAPETAISAGLHNGGKVKSAVAVNYTWAGTDNATLPQNLRYQFRFDAEGWSPVAATTTTSKTFTALQAGPHTFDVRAVDEANNVDPTPDHYTLTIDDTAPIAFTPQVFTNTWDSLRVTWETNEATTGRLEWAEGNGAFGFSMDSPGRTTNHTIVIGPLRSHTLYRVRVVARDEAGNERISSISEGTTAHKTDLAVRADDIVFSPATPNQGVSMTMAVTVRNLGDTPASATVIFHDYYPGGSTTEIGRATVTNIAAQGAQVVSSPAFTATPEGRHSPWVELVEITPTDNDSNNRWAQKDLMVGAPPLRLAATISTQKTWPGLETLFTVIVQNTGSSPQTLTSLQVTGAEWVTCVSATPADPIAPGAEAQLTFRINTPSLEALGNPESFPVLFPMQFTVVGGDTYDFPFTVEVYEGALGQVKVIVQGPNNSRLTNALVALDNSNAEYYTNASGEVLVDSLTGTRNIYAIAQGYMPGMLNVNVLVGSVTTATITLEAGNALDVSEVTVRELTPDEIEDRGVDLEDPANYWVYDFTVYAHVVALPLPSIVLPRNPGVGTSYSGGGYCPGGGGYCPGGGGVSGTPGYTVHYDIYYPTPDPTQRVETWIIIPGDIRILKQFWDATVVVRNTTNAYTIENVQATLLAPQGLAFPDLFGEAQAITQSIGTIGPLEEKQASWVIRGDRAGRYRVTGSATGELVLGGARVPLTSSLESDEFEVVQPRMDVAFEMPGIVRQDQLFTLGIRVTNSSSIDLHGVSVNIKADKLVNCHLADGQPTRREIGTTFKGETYYVYFNFVSHVTGRIANDSYVSADSNLEPTLIVEQIDNTDPVAVDDAFQVFEGEILTVGDPGVLANDSDADGDNLVASHFNEPAHGVLHLQENGAFTYTPAVDYIGEDSFQYTTSDNMGGTVHATVRITVRESIQVYQPEVYVLVPGEDYSAGVGIYNIDPDQTVGRIVGVGTTARYRITVANALAADTLKVTGPGASPGWQVAYFAEDESPITAQVTGAGWQPATLPAVLFLEVTPTAPVQSGAVFTARVQATSQGDTRETDSILAVTTKSPYQPDLIVEVPGEDYGIGNDIYNLDADQTVTRTHGLNLAYQYTVTISNDRGPDAIRITGPASADGWTIAYMTEDEVNVTDAVTTNPGWQVTQSPVRLHVSVTPTIDAPSGSSKTLTVVGRSESDAGASDRVLLVSTKTAAWPMILTAVPAAQTTVGTAVALSTSAPYDDEVSTHYQFRLGRFSGGAWTWTVIQSYGNAPTATWTPEIAGTYQLVVYARPVASSLLYDVVATLDYTVVPALNYQPDAMVRVQGAGPYQGNDLYNQEIGQKASQTVVLATTATYEVKIENDEDAENVRVTGPAGSNGWTIAYQLEDGSPITDAITTLGWTPPALPAVIRVLVTPTPAVAGGQALTVACTVTSSHLAQKTDAVSLITTASGTPAEVIVDNSELSKVTLTGRWFPSTSAPGFYGANYLYDDPAQKGVSSARFTPTIPGTGIYAIYLRWRSSNAGLAASVPVDIVHADGTTTTLVNQRLYGGTWVKLGTYRFTAGTAGSIRIRTDGTTGYVIADAVRWVPAMASEVIIDNADPSGVTVIGTWSLSNTAPGYHGANYLFDTNPAQKGSSSVRFTPVLTGTGAYEVFLRWRSPASNLASNVPVEITHAGGTSSLYINQRLNGGSWVSLGTYAFTAGSAGNILVKTGGTNGYVIADAVRCTPVAGTEVIVDNAEPSGVTVTGTWFPSSTSPGYYGVNYLYDTAAQRGTSSVRFTPAVPAVGTYAVFMRWRASAATLANNVPVDITHQGGTSTVTVNQRIGGGTWVLLGVYGFAEGATGNVLIRTAGANGYVIADAVRLVRVSADVIVDNTENHAATLTGSWFPSTTAPGYYGTNYHYDNLAQKGTTSARFTPTLPTTGSYAVYMRWRSHNNALSAAVPVDITYQGGSITRTVNQQQNGGEWVYLGAFPFAKGATGNVLVRTTGTTGYVIADAFRFQQVE
jgi:hypothetical protein